MQPQPPSLFLRLFRWYCHPKLVSHIEGDLVELYRERLKTKGKRTADVRFIIDVLLLFRPGIIRPAEYQQGNPYGMYKNYLLSSWRNLVKNKTFSIINISGLSLGLACSIFIALWVNDEYQINAFHKDIDRIFIVTSCEFSGDERNGTYDTPGLLGDELKKALPEVEYSTSFSWAHNYVFAVDDKRLRFRGSFAGVDFLSIFSYPLLLGKKETALTTPNSIAISRSMAVTLFGSPEAAMNKAVRFENSRDLDVTAVFDDLGDNVSEKFDYLINWEFFVERNSWVKNWHNSGLTTFFKIREHTNIKTLKPKLQHFIRNYDAEYSDLDRLELGAQPFAEMYLHSNFKNGYLSGGRIEYVQLFEWVAIFVLLIACINFMNLSSARALKRAKEIGVRKVVGAVKTALMGQFMLEAFLFTFIAVLCSLILVCALLPQFNLLTGKNIASPLFSSTFWLGIAVLSGITAILSGSYPALLLSSFKPLAILKNNLKLDSSSVLFRRGLVVFQFTLSVIFIIGMIVISRQVQFIQTKNLGYQKENLIWVPIRGDIGENFSLFKNEAARIPGINSIASMSDKPVQIENTTGDVVWEGKSPTVKPTFVQSAVGYDFIRTMNSTLIMGRDFSPEMADSTNYIINETALRIIGYKNPIGMPLTFWGKKGTIIGVVKDFHFNSLHVPVSPLVLRLAMESRWGFALIRVDGQNTVNVITALEELHKRLNPEFPFVYKFADQEYELLYKSEQMVKSLSWWFAGLAIFISCLGLLGLVMFTTEQRVKEVGIRKVLGASSPQIVTLLSKDFLGLVVFSVFIATPLAYVAMREWLKGFEYHIALQWWMFMVAAGGAIAVTILTVSFQALKAAAANPAHSLKSE